MTMPLNVLVVDDSKTMRRVIARTLGISGLPIGQVFEALNGAEALQKLARGDVDLALLDLNMPVMGGLEALERIRESVDTVDLPVVVVSTEGSEPRIERVRQLSAGFVRKPFAPESLVKAIVIAIGGRGHVGA
jgi:two-component system, chemotaxis family, chemotaxis protein CheY